jgi:putative transposase
VKRFECVDDQKAAGFPVTAACEAAGVSTSGYYDWCEREAAGPTERQLAEADLVALMQDLFAAADGNYGVPRMFKALRKAGLVVNRKRVARLMRLHGMAGRFRRRRCRTTFPGPDGYHIPDLIGRRFAPGKPDVAWCQDITYIPTREGWLYLASVLDLGSRRLLGYSMAEHMRTELVVDALKMAVAARGGDKAVIGVIAHADRGSQGGFKWLSQHLDCGGACGWGRCGSGSGRFSSIEGRCRRRGGRRWRGGRTACGSGMRSLVG